MMQLKFSVTPSKSWMTCSVLDCPRADEVTRVLLMPRTRHLCDTPDSLMFVVGDPQDAGDSGERRVARKNKVNKEK